MSIRWLAIYCSVVVALGVPTTVSAAPVILGWWERRVEVTIDAHHGFGSHNPGAAADPTVTSTPAIPIDDFPWHGSGAHSETIFLDASSNAGPFLNDMPLGWDGTSMGMYAKYSSIRVVWVYVPFAGNDPDDVLTDDHVVEVTESPLKIEGKVEATGSARDLREPGAADPEYIAFGVAEAELTSKYLVLNKRAPIVSPDKTEFTATTSDSGVGTGGSPPPAPHMLTLDARGYAYSPAFTVDVLGVEMDVDVNASDSGTAKARVDATLSSDGVVSLSPAAAPSGEWQHFSDSGMIMLFDE